MDHRVTRRSTFRRSLALGLGPQRGDAGDGARAPGGKSSVGCDTQKPTPTTPSSPSADTDEDLLAMCRGGRGLEAGLRERTTKAAAASRRPSRSASRVRRSTRSRACESGGDPTAVDADGTYRGKYQFDNGTWASVGGSGRPRRRPGGRAGLPRRAPVQPRRLQPLAGLRV